MSDTFLNGTGLTNLWNKIKTLVAAKQDKLTMGSLSNIDLDTLKTAGYYWITNTGITNAPSGEGVTYGILEVISAGVGAHQQIYYLFDSTKGNRTVYTREFINNQWYQWVRITTGYDVYDTTISLGTNLSGTYLKNNGDYGETYRSYGLDVDFTDSYTAKTSLSAVSVPSGSRTSLHSFELSKGLYHIEAAAYFPQNATGVRGLDLTSSASSAETSGASYYLASQNLAAINNTMNLHVSLYLKVASTTTYYLRAYQNSGSAMNVTPRLQILKLND